MNFYALQRQLTHINNMIITLALTGMWLSGRAFALHVKGPGFDPRHLQSKYFVTIVKMDSIFFHYFKLSYVKTI